MLNLVQKEFGVKKGGVIPSTWYLGRDRQTDDIQTGINMDSYSCLPVEMERGIDQLIHVATDSLCLPGPTDRARSNFWLFADL